MIFIKNGFWMFIESLNPDHYANNDFSFADCLVRKIIEEMHTGEIDSRQIVLIKPEDELEREAGSMTITTIPPEIQDIEDAEEKYTVSSVPLKDIYSVGIEKALFDGYVIVCENFLASKIEEAEHLNYDIEDMQHIWEENNLEPDLVVYLDGEDNSWFGYSRKFVHEQLVSLHKQDPEKYIILDTETSETELCDKLWEIFKKKSQPMR